MCVDIYGLIITIMYFVIGMLANYFFVDFDNGEKFSVWLMIFWPIILIVYIFTWLIIGLPWHLWMWFNNKFRDK